MSNWRILFSLFLISQTQLALAQFDIVDFREVKDKPEPAPIVNTSEIPVEPRVINPIELMPKPLQKKVTFKFEDASIREILDWIKETVEMPVLIDERAMKNVGIDFEESINEESLTDTPIFELLNRLSYSFSFSLSWYVADDVLYITTVENEERYMVTTTYDIGDLIAAGYSTENVIDAIQDLTTGPWFESEGIGGESISNLGTVLFVRQNPSVHRQVQTLLTGLQSHGRLSYANISLAELNLIEGLDKKITVTFEKERLDAVVQKLGEIAQADIRLAARLEEEGVHGHDLISAQFQDIKLRTVIQELVKDTPVKPLVLDGVLWITTKDYSDAVYLNTFFDVRDLSRDEDEAAALISAIQRHTSGPWFEIDGIGGTIRTPKPGLIAMRTRQETIREVEDILNKYRDALANLKHVELIPARQLTDVISRYYRLQADTAKSLEASIPTMVAPDSWQVNQNDAKGTIRKVAGGTEFLRRGLDADGMPQASEVPVDMSVLIITQTRENHIHIGRIIHLIQSGDPLWTSEGEALGIYYEGFGGAAGERGMGFGGGFFAVPVQN